MTVGADVNYEELARSTDEFNAAQLKAVCVEAGMIALREGATKLGHEHFLSGISEGMSPAFLSEFELTDTLVVYSAKQEEERPHVFCVDCPCMVRLCIIGTYYIFLPISRYL